MIFIPIERDERFRSAFSGANASDLTTGCIPHSVISGADDSIHRGRQSRAAKLKQPLLLVVAGKTKQAVLCRDEQCSFPIDSEGLITIVECAGIDRNCDWFKTLCHTTRNSFAGPHPE